jgi:hypothetical protein
MFVRSEIAPLLKQDTVCNLIVKAIRQNKNQLLIPKMLNVSLALNRLENERYTFKK